MGRSLLNTCPHPVHAMNTSTPPKTGGPVESSVLDDLVAANHILADQGVLDGFGHVSVRHPSAADRYLLSRSKAPAIIAIEDILEFDLDSNPVDQQGRLMYIERFIHGEIYRARPDVNAIVHSHSPTVIPFGVTQVKLAPICHMSAFLGGGVPNFEIRNVAGMTDLLIRDAELGRALAATLGTRNVALMRGHGNVCVGRDLMVAVYRAVYTELNAKLQAQAIALGGPVTFLEAGEYEQIQARSDQNVQRPWQMWKRRVGAK
jgi:HCOMODA/2-hydroxy-3-carboxy-muconic semialdehyde decarboxylase